VDVLRAGPTDPKIKALHSDLLDNVKCALAAERLDCKPIRGIDLPLARNPDMNLLEVEHLDRLDVIPI
jgi:hypothetical protein